MAAKKKIIILFVIVIVIAVGIFVYKKNQGKVIYTSNTQSAPETSTPAVIIDQVKKTEFEQAIKKVASHDQDFDGLSDSQEATYKTDPTLADTDGDGLTDWQEIFIYKTDPLKADTDGDTFADGYEVRRGFSPKGKGKL